jgi:hypothetical protein
MSKAAITTLQTPAAADAAEAAICLKDLVSQIELGRLTDEFGHDFSLNDAYLRAVELLERIEGKSGEV